MAVGRGGGRLVMRRRIAAYAARELAVNDAGDWRQWLLRLFVLAETEQKSTGPGRWLDAVLQAAITFCARELAVAEPGHAGQWLLRLFILPSPPGDADRLSNMAGRIGRRLRRALAIADAGALGKRLESANGWLTGLSRAALLGLGMLAAFSVMLGVTTPLDNSQQIVFLLVLWLAAFGLSKLPGALPVVVLVTLSLLALMRYAFWRVTESMDLNSPAELLLAYGLLGAEAYTWLIAVLGYLQSIMPLRRPPADLPGDGGAWPTVDVYIPTYNEPLKVVRTTVFAAQGLDWPEDKLNVYLLDDGRREEFRDFAEQAGVGYIIRPNNAHAKAGNLNHAMTVTSGEYIAIFDCDHVPTRSFLQLSMGWFLKNPNCALVQTPHHFFSPDPFERNLDNFRQVPNENYLFHRLVQDGNDLWNAAFFCGSCAVLRRQPLQEIGGVAVETVTEDAHTALKLHRLGYDSIYINIPQAAGLATESLSGHIGQRIRWARGMVQIFRMDNPLFGEGLSLFQRICYSTAMLHFLMGIPRLVFLTAPLAYLLFDLHTIQAPGQTLALYVLPYLAHTGLAKSRMQGRYRHSFWADVYDTALAWYITPPTTLALINPKLGKFNVTPKGGLVETAFFDWSISKPYLLLVTANLLGLVAGLIHLCYWHSHEADVVLLNIFWTSFNLIVLGATLSVADEAKQVRDVQRIPVDLPAVLHLPNGRAWHCKVADYSTGGFGLRLSEPLDVAPQDSVTISLARGDQEFSFAAEVAVNRGGHLGVRFKEMTLDEERQLVQCTFARADAWAHWHEQHEFDYPMKGFTEVIAVSLHGYARLFRRLLSRRMA